MRIYFYDGDVKFAPYIPINHDAVTHYVYAEYGPKRNKHDLDYIYNLEGKHEIVTNSLLALSHYYGWNDEENHTDIYIWTEKFQEYIRIDKLAQGNVRYAQNIEKMYLADVFRID